MNGETFKELREKHGYSRKEIENRLYAGESMVQSWEEGWSLINPSSGEIEELAEIFSKDIPFLRVDMYVINGQIYMSEFTFYPGAGFTPFEPFEWEEKIGSWIKLK